MLHSLQKATKTRYEIPAALWRLAFSSLFAQKKFDFAQDDRLIVCFVVFVRFRRDAREVAQWRERNE